MADELLPYVEWIGPLLTRPLPEEFVPGTPDHEILAAFRDGWGTSDTTTLLTGLEARFGDRARDVVGRFVEISCRRDWATIGEREAHPGTELDDFIRVLWGPLPDVGFEFVVDESPDGTERQFTVTRCPVADAARAVGMEKWMYPLSCATDLYTTPAFCPRIEFDRTETLMEGASRCNHHYRLRADG